MYPTVQRVLAALGDVWWFAVQRGSRTWYLSVKLAVMMSLLNLLCFKGD